MQGHQETFFNVGNEDSQVIAGVYVDVDLPHLDHPLDYCVPHDLLQEAQIGRSVIVRLAGRKVGGWIVSLSHASEHTGSLSPIIKVVSSTRIVTEKIFTLARYIADKNVATLSQVLSLAIPARRRAQELSFLKSNPPQEDSVSFTGHIDDEIYARSIIHPWLTHRGGSALLQHLQAGGYPRAVWTGLPTSWDTQILSLIHATRASKRSVIIVFPTERQCLFLAKKLLSNSSPSPENPTFIPSEKIRVLSSHDSPGKRYLTHLLALRGDIQVLIGTRSAVWAPMRNLGLILVWDDGDDRLSEQRAPRTSAFDVGVARSHLESVSLVIGSLTRTVKAQELVRSSWAVSLAAQRPQVREATPRVRVPDESDRERQGPAGSAHIPPDAFRLVRSALKTGPVLISVPTRGYVPVIACDRCRAIARCPFCQGPLAMDSNRSINCRWCGKGIFDWRCPACGWTHLRALRIGSDRTGEEFGRAFPKVPLTISTADYDFKSHIDNSARIVVATAGMEPQAEGGYASCLILDAHAVASRSELWAGEEALRRWFNALSLVRPGNTAMVVGTIPSLLAQTVIRWDPISFAQRTLDEREQLHFFPSVTIIALDGNSTDIAHITAQLGAEILGEVPIADANTTFSPQGVHSEDIDQIFSHAAIQPQVRVLVRCSHQESDQVLTKLRLAQQHRAAHKQPLVKITVNPPEFF